MFFSGSSPVEKTSGPHGTTTLCTPGSRFLAMKSFSSSRSCNRRLETRCRARPCLFVFLGGGKIIMERWLEHKWIRLTKNMNMNMNVNMNMHINIRIYIDICVYINIYIYIYKYTYIYICGSFLKWGVPLNHPF